jgi:hypothetical protein
MQWREGREKCRSAEVQKCRSDSRKNRIETGIKTGIETGRGSEDSDSDGQRGIETENRDRVILLITH